MSRISVVNEAYKKLKYLAEILLKNEVIHKDLSILKNKDISYDTLRRYMGMYKRVRLVESPLRGQKKIKDKYLDNIFLDDNKKNALIISSIVHLNANKSGENALNYLFQDALKSFTYKFTNQYNNKFNKQILELIDNENYNKVARIILMNKDATKSVSKIFNTKKNCYEEIVLLEFFIYQDSGYICCYKLNQKVLEILNTDYISEIKTQKKVFTDHILTIDIENFVKTFIDKFSAKDEVVLLRMKAETLSLLIDFKLIDEFDVFKTQKYENKKNFQGNENKYKDKINHNKIALKRINLDSLQNENDEQKNVKEGTIQFDFVNPLRPKKYFVKTKISPHKLTYITNSYKNIEQINFNEVEIIV